MLEISQLLAYATALSLAVSIPGPGITALVARTIATGVPTAFAMLWGMILGDLIFLTFAVFGLAFIAKSFAAVFALIKWCSVVYLFILAWEFWHAKHQKFSSEKLSNQSKRSAILSGLAVTLGNPKPVFFYLALLPALIDLSLVSFNTWLYNLLPITILVLSVIGGLFILCANAVRKQLAHQTAQRKMCRLAALAMAGAASSIALRDV